VIELLSQGRDLLGLIVALVVPIFVAMDPLGALPLIVAWTGNLERPERNRQLRDALVTALLLGLLFILGGARLLDALGVTVADFLMAGGLILLVLAVSDIAVGGSHEARGSTGRPDFGAVPIGTPILAGPATLATLMVQVERYGFAPTALAFSITLLVAWRLFRRAELVTRLLGRNGLRAISKVVSLLLAAIAVKLIREGLAGVPSPFA
jgi:multiple antibiotic resistance protein